MQLIREVFDALWERPNARALVLEALEDDAKHLADHMRAAGMRAGHGERDQVLVLSVSEYSRHKTNLGVVDIVWIHNRYNMRRVDKDKKFKGVKAFLTNQRHRIKWHTVNASQLPDELAPLAPVMGWACGEPLELKCKPWPFVAQDVYTEPCGADNPRHAMYCRHCGRFRGVIYKESV